MKLDASSIKYLEDDDFRVLIAIEMVFIIFNVRGW
jgi:hypothetical protein